MTSLNKTMLSPRTAKLICLIALACSPVLFYGAKGALQSQTNNILDWLPSSFEETQRLFWFVERFGSDEVLVASWPGCDLEDERLDILRAGLLEPMALPDESSPPSPLFGFVLTGRQMLSELTSEPLELPPDEAVDRMRGWLLGPDGRSTCAMAFVSPVGGRNRPAAVEHVYRVAEAAGVPRESIRVGGPTADSVAVNVASQQWTVELGFLSTFVGISLAWLCLRNFRLVGLLYCTAMFAWAISLSLIHYRGVKMDAVLLMVPALVFILAVSGGIHLSNYLYDASRDVTFKEAPRRAVAAGWLPCTLAALTTAVGLAALATSRVIPVHRFGVFAAAGVLATLVALLALWPALAQTFLSRRLTSPLAGPPRTEWWRPLLVLADRRSRLVTMLALASVPLFACGVLRLRTSVQMQDLLRSSSTLIQDQLWLTEKIGPLIPVEVVLRFPQVDRGDRKAMLRRAELVESLRKRIASWDQTGGAVALTTFAPALPESGGARQLMARRAVASHLHHHRPDFLDMGLLFEDEHEELWRISARISSMEIDYGQFLAKLHERIERVLAEDRQTEPEVSAEICGGVPLIFMAQRQLLTDLARSFLAAFVLIAIIMTVLMRGLLAGLVAMVPNVFPALVAFGTMGLMETAIDIGTMMTASVAMGIAVDDTLHFLVWFRRGLQMQKSRSEAIEFAFGRCGTGILQTSIICGLGIAPFLFSPFVPVARFAYVLFLLLLLALVADLILLPALLSGPLGKLFVRDDAAASNREKCPA